MRDTQSSEIKEKAWTFTKLADLIKGYVVSKLNITQNSKLFCLDFANFAKYRIYFLRLQKKYIANLCGTAVHHYESCNILASPQGK